MRRHAIIVDIDGTLANIDHRRHLVSGENNHWNEFFQRMTLDTPNKWCSDLIDLYHSGRVEILLVTGRPSNFGEQTSRWLKHYVIPYSELFMRQEGDYRPDQEIKKEIYKTKIEPFYEVLFVVDDRAKVVKMWRELGLVTLACAEGNY